jgi:hypothetical protein
MFNRYILFLLVTLSANLAFGYSNADKKYVDNTSRQLLKTIKWDQQYDIERQKDVNYLFGSISGELFKNLTPEQKALILESMKASTLKQILGDRDLFKNYILSQYNQFFTTDELNTLTKYFQTKVMQMVIQSQIDQKQLSSEDISMKLALAPPQDQVIIDQLRDSYLNARYTRFQEKIQPKVNEMIYKRMQEILKQVLNNLPNLIKDVQSNG